MNQTQGFCCPSMESGHVTALHPRVTLCTEYCQPGALAWSSVFRVSLGLQGRVRGHPSPHAKPHHSLSPHGLPLVLEVHTAGTFSVLSFNNLPSGRPWAGREAHLCARSGLGAD